MAGLLALITLAVYWNARSFEFVDLDDSWYVSEIAMVQSGLTWDGVRWALTTYHSAHWHPLTWLSLMADTEWQGNSPRGYHFTNLLLHTAGSILLFYVLDGLTSATWRSAWVAALFALHPLHVESVAWVTERKDVLSGVFWMLTLGAYVQYVRRRQWNWYGLTILAYGLGLMAKPMVVTLPFVLLLLDYWPLQRAPRVSWKHLVGEKIPMFALTAASCLLTLLAGQSAKMPLEQMAIAQRLVNSVVAYAIYLHKMIWPVDLTCFYPHPGHWPVGTVIMAALFLATGSFLALLTRRRCPAILVGWCWHLGTLVPVIGLVQVGGQALADRYTYLPLIGVWIALAWGLTDWASHHPAAKRLLATLAVLAVAGCISLTIRQLATWRDSLTLFRHAIAVTENNWMAHNSLGTALGRRGRLAEAVPQFERALAINPHFADAYSNLGLALQGLGRIEEAVTHYQEALRLKPDFAKAYCNWGTALVAQGKLPEAMAQFREAVRLNPTHLIARENLRRIEAALHPSPPGTPAPRP